MVMRYSGIKIPVDLVEELRADMNEVELRQAFYGIDSPTGLLMSSFAAPLYLYATLSGKFTFWDQELERIEPALLAGNTLDAGCGRGMVLIKTAKHKLEKSALGIKGVSPDHKEMTCKAYGIDIFDTRDQSGNSPRATVSNLVAEKVETIVSLHRANFCDLPFGNDSFSLVTSSLALHNPPKAEDRVKAVKELARVLRPGGKIIILDLVGRKQTTLYERVLRDELGWTDVQRKFAGAGVMFGMWYCEVIRATKPVMTEHGVQ